MATLIPQYKRLYDKAPAPKAATPFTPTTNPLEAAYKGLADLGWSQLGKLEKGIADKKTKTDAEDAAAKLATTTQMGADFKIRLEKESEESEQNYDPNVDPPLLEMKAELATSLGQEMLVELGAMTKNDPTSIFSFKKSVTEHVSNDIQIKERDKLNKKTADHWDADVSSKYEEWKQAVIAGFLSVDEALVAIKNIGETKPFSSPAQRKVFILGKQAELIKATSADVIAKNKEDMPTWFDPYDPNNEAHQSQTKYTNEADGKQYVFSAAAPASVKHLKGNELTKVFDEAQAEKNKQAGQEIEANENMRAQEQVEEIKIQQGKADNKQAQVNVIVLGLMAVPESERSRQAAEAMKLYPTDEAKEEAGYKIALGLWNANRKFEADPTGYFIKHNGVIADLNQTYEQALENGEFEQAGVIRTEMAEVVLKLSEGIEKDPKYVLATQELSYWRDKYQQGKEAENAEDILAVFDQMKAVFGDERYFNEALLELTNDSVDAHRNPAIRAISSLNLVLPHIPQYAQKAIAVDAQYSHAQFDDKYEVDAAREHEVIKTMLTDMAKKQFEGHEKYMQMDVQALRLDPEFELAYRLAVSYQSNKMFMRSLQIPRAINDVFIKSEAQQMRYKLQMDKE